jgi:transcriptional regulator with XRE-family HTH domain
VQDAETVAGESDRTLVNRVVAYNMTRWRKAAGLTQEELGQRLGGWSGASVSAAERSWDGKRVRKFDADEVAAIGAALGVPIVALFLPPLGGGEAAVRLFALTMPETGEDTPVMDAFRKERAFAAAQYADPVRSRRLIEFMEALASPEEREKMAGQQMSSLQKSEMEYRRRLRAAANRLLDELGPEREPDLEGDPEAGQ